MRAGFVVPSLQEPSGWRTAALGTIRALRDQLDLRPVLLVSAADATAARELFAEDEVLELPETQDMSLSRFRSWPRVLGTRWAVERRTLPALDFVHSLDAYPTGLVGHWLARRIEVPHVLTALGTYAVSWSSKAIDRKLYSRVLSSASLICPMSHGTASLMRTHFQKPLAGVPNRVVHLGTDFTERVPRAIAWEREPDREPLVLSVAALKPRKGLDLTITAFATVQREFPSARLVIVGDPGNGSYKAQLMEHARQVGASNLSFIGNVSQEELQRLYRKATLFALTPRMVDLQFEGFGLVYLEAGAFGLPVVATETGGVPDAVQTGITGFLEPEDPRRLAAAMLRLLRDPALARKMGRANREHAEVFTWKRFAMHQSEAYRRSSPPILVDRSQPIA